MIEKSVWVTWPIITKMFGTVGVFASLLILVQERETLFENNLFDLESEEYYLESVECGENTLKSRTLDGTCNILENPMEGSVHTIFGKNVNPETTVAALNADLLLEPNPREISNVLMSRDEFIPATTLNFIAAAWIQFMTHDWFSHPVSLEDESKIIIPMPENDPYFDSDDVIEISRTISSGTISDFQVYDEENEVKERISLSEPVAVYRNRVTHWWDGSQIYGTSVQTNSKIRSFVDGKLRLDSEGFIPTSLDGVPVQGFTDNWWLGLSMLHNLFVKEHNAIAEALKAAYPEMDDQELYDKARLANSALMAKIHTVEWTPAIIANPTTVRALYSNWWGILGTAVREGRASEEEKQWYRAALSKDGFFYKMLKAIPELSELADEISLIPPSVDYAINGIAGTSEPNNYGVPYTLTEEFVQVYRMHPLMRDNLDVYDVNTGALKESIPLLDTTFSNGEDVFRESNQADLWYGFGITHPGALTLKNYPDSLRNIDIPFRGALDMATIDIVRDRERGIPRYNEFRRQIGLIPITSFEQLFEGRDMTDPANVKLLEDMKAVYKNDVELIDPFVGEMAESVRPEGFGFSETAFQIFIMNASRRLLADRFFTTEYKPETYSQVGIDWVENTTMIDVLLRHYPELADRLTDVENAFKPWSEPSSEACSIDLEEELSTENTASNGNC